MLRGLDTDLMARVKTYARDHNLLLATAAAVLMAAGLRSLERAAAGGHARATALTADERSAIARHAALTRHQRQQDG